MELSQFIDAALITLDQMQYLPQILWFLLAGILISEFLFQNFPHLLIKIGAPFKPIVKACNLPTETASILISSIGSSLAANGAIVNLYKSDKLSKKQTISAGVLNSIPTYIRRLFTIYLPVILPLFGIKFFLAFAAAYCSCIIPKYILCVIYAKTDKKARSCCFNKN